MKDKIKILFDHQIFSTHICGGISRYFYELIKHFNLDDNIDVALSLDYSNNNYLNQYHHRYNKTFLENINFRGKAHLINFINKQKSKKVLRGQDFTIFHPTYYDPYFLDFIGTKPFVLTIHDMIHELFFDQFFVGDKAVLDRKKILAQKASKIVTVSENTKLDIVRLYRIPENKIRVIYHGNSLQSKFDCIPNNYKGAYEKYILYVGSREFYKNFNTFIQAAVPILKDDDSLHIVCAGGLDISNDEFKLFRNLKITERIHHYAFVDDGRLSCLYKNALAFIFPSLYEGFGMPILESFACGCPAIVSKSSSLTEVAGNAAAYFDPTDSQSITETIRNVIYDTTIMEEMKRKGFLRIKDFSWEKASAQTKSVYLSIL